MAQILLHGNLHVTIFEASSLSHPGRASGGAPKFIRKVIPQSYSRIISDFSLHFIFFLSKTNQLIDRYHARLDMLVYSISTW